MKLWQRGILTIALVVAYLAAMAWALGAHAEWRLDVMNRTIDQTNFQINGGCSGTLIDIKERVILTANHCVQDQYETVERERIDKDGVIKKEKIRRIKEGTVKQYQYVGNHSAVATAYKVKLVLPNWDESVDLALMKTLAPLPNTVAATMACKLPERGETVYTVGNPTGRLYASVTKGIVSNTKRDYGALPFGSDSQSKDHLMQISSGVIGGNSGGAVYNDEGELVGVPVVGHRANEILGFAVPLDTIKAFLTTHGYGRLFNHCVN